MRLCKKCGVEKDDAEFYHHRAKRYECKECANWRAKGYRYGVSKEQYNEMLMRQSMKCLICDKEKKLGIDHCHSSGKVRGLLCNRCNSFLGEIDQNPAVLDNLKEYHVAHQN